MATYGYTDVGKQRDVNEDSVATDSFQDVELLIVADGMGGHSAGEIASQCATETIRQHVESAITDHQDDYQTILREAIQTANQAIHQRAEDESSLSGMGTTAVVALCDGDEATIINVGDSRAYHVTESIEQVTVDQSLVQELVDQGEITQAEAENHPRRNVVSQSLGTSEEVDPDLYQISVDGTLLLCSDGLSEEVDDEKINQTINESGMLESVATTLVRTANENGGKDNISVALYDNYQD